MVGIAHYSDLVVLSLSCSHLDNISETACVGSGIVRAQVGVASLNTDIEDLLVSPHIASCCSVHDPCLSYRERR